MCCNTTQNNVFLMYVTHCSYSVFGFSLSLEMSNCLLLRICFIISEERVLLFLLVAEGGLEYNIKE